MFVMCPYCGSKETDTAGKCIHCGKYISLFPKIRNDTAGNVVLVRQPLTIDIETGSIKYVVY
jgi:predicted ATP-dependent serine protease